MKMTTEPATLAEAEEDLDDDGDDEEEDGKGEHSDHDEDASSSETCTFDVPHFRYIDDDDDVDEKHSRTWFSSSADEDCCGSSSYRYVVVSGTPLKILEHLLSDLRLDDQRGAPESRESGKFGDTQKCFVVSV